MTARRNVERAVEAHADELAEFPNVVGIGIMESSGDRSASDPTLAVAVYVSEKKPASELQAGALLPGFVEIDDAGDSVKIPVKVIEMGDLGPQNAAPSVAENQPNEDGDGSTFSPQ